MCLKHHMVNLIHYYNTFLILFGELDKHEGIHDKYAEDEEFTATFGERKRIRSESLNAKELKKRQKR